MTTFRWLIVLSALAGILIWATWVPVEQKNMTPQELYGAAAAMTGAERVYKGFQQ